MIGGSAPLEVRVAALVFALGGLLFAGGSFAWGTQIGDTSVAIVPAVDAVVGLLLGGLLAVGARAARMPAFVWAALITILQIVLALGVAPVWLRILCGLLAAAHVYAFVLLNTAPAGRYLGGAR
ncbi:hypothetical protein GCM10010174_65090 [Kutzneria viridogrisea]|uniref:Uncharacterized protein n=2 Tax=Kutzneria TaxID=43356 RepID=W5WQE9_9PSEU|nr:hypothetical protein [Kutzneria albida]AHI00405.1 hypothetical protein KALB_7047 [Kutzneria albida DSM 43870]MBA8925582.1 hypothetical protein [Kutzneria viridogrisea]